MRIDRIFSAPSLSDIMKQLMIYRPSGLLNIQRVIGSRQEEATITIERGRPMHILWDRQEEEANETNLAWLNTWGEIRFTFQSLEPLLQLPPPSQPSSSEKPFSFEHAPQLTPSITRPIPSIPKTNNAQLTGSLRRTTTRLPHNGKGEHASLANPNAQPSFADESAHPEPETVIPVVTPLGKDLPATQVPRYDRVVFLLINGKRTVADLAQLTKRAQTELYTSLYRLQSQQLITIEPPPTNRHVKPR